MGQENIQQNQETTSKNTVNKTDSSTSSTQTTGSAATVKKYDKTDANQTTGAVREFYDKAKQTAGQVTEKAAEKLDEKKSVVTEGLSGVADSIRQVGKNLRGAKGAEENPIADFTNKYGDSLATQIENISEYFDSKNVREIVGDVESFARRNPAVFIGGAFALGILAARFLKSSSPKQLTKAKGQSFGANYSNGEKFVL